jgi:UDP:flavonoid glycosyltransferase YjiC (YdhE family)
VLSEVSYRQRVRQLQTELARHDASTDAAGLLERLADTQRPVV